jgi:hypothetical protein
MKDLPGQKHLFDLGKVKAQGIFDLFSILDNETIEKIKKIIAAINPDKIQQIMDCIEAEDGWVKIKIGLAK